jgi:hypothetical protein
MRGELAESARCTPGDSTSLTASSQVEAALPGCVTCSIREQLAADAAIGRLGLGQSEVLRQ